MREPSGKSSRLFGPAKVLRGLQYGLSGDPVPQRVTLRQKL
ncbi:MULTISPECIES: hypothetical protein [Carboxydothermus]|nr:MULTISPECIES: hypothetical protein [Carboxydothermus]